uniref:Methyltransferase 1, tRNA methylguanosine n=1 Tax=Gopherus evgoodei TaxID=1825980 RepID=A0A8C4WDM9_9SAUR
MSTHAESHIQFGLYVQQLPFSVLALSGLLGPTIRAEVYDTVVVTFKNLASRPFSLHAVGVTYWKASEGAGYKDETSQAEKEDDEVDPGNTHTYVWEILEDQGPTEFDSSCLTSSYFSYTDSVKDINSGLIGALLVCRPGEEHGELEKSVEFVLLFSLFSHWCISPPFLADLQLCQKRPVHWHVIGLGTAPEVHSIFFEGHTFLPKKKMRLATDAPYEDYYDDSYDLDNTVIMFDESDSPPSIGARAFAKQAPMTWTHYIAAEEVDWDYAPITPTYLDSQFLEAGPQRIGSKYKKVMFVEYEDGTFKKRKVSDQRDTGILGPVLKGEVGDQFLVRERERCQYPPLAVASNAFERCYVKGIPIEPGQSFKYSWKVTTEDGPAGSDPRCLTHFYYSSINPVRDTASGLIGPLLICSKESMDQRGNQVSSSLSEFVLFSVFDENHSWYLAENIQRFCTDAATVNPQDPDFYASNVIHSINGYVFDNLHLKLCLHQVVYWYVLSVGAQTDFLSVFFSGNTFKHNMVFKDTLTLFPLSGETVFMSMEKPDTDEFDIYGDEEDQDLRTFTGRVQQYFIAAVEVLWEYESQKPQHFLKVNRGWRKPFQRYKKVVFRGYLDNSFTQPLARGELDEHLGILGPYIRAEVDDVIMVSFKNLASRPYSFHSNLLPYQGGLGENNTPSQEAVQPGELREYSWKVLPQMAPTDNEFDCKAWAYFSSVNLEKDLHSGLVGPLLICRPGILSRAFRRQLEVQEFSLLFTIFDETKSWYLAENMERNCPPFCQIQPDDPNFRRSSYFHAINGYVMDALPGLVMAQHQRVRWYLLNVGGTEDIHSVYFHGQQFAIRTNHECWELTCLLERTDVGEAGMPPGTHTTLGQYFTL